MEISYGNIMLARYYVITV